MAYITNWKIVHTVFGYNRIFISQPEKVASDPIYMLTELNIFDIGRQIAKGMKYLADIKIIHGDLAARNILVSEVRDY